MSPPPRRRPNGRRPVRPGPGPGRSPGTLHHLAAVLSLAARGEGTSRGMRRRRQHLALAQRLLDPLPPALRPPAQAADRFWRALRWGGGGLLVAVLLGR